jgi:hypothetical protein
MRARAIVLAAAIVMAPFSTRAADLVGSRPSSWCKLGGGLRWPWVRPPELEVGVARGRLLAV